MKLMSTNVALTLATALVVSTAAASIWWWGNHPREPAPNGLLALMGLTLISVVASTFLAANRRSTRAQLTLGLILAIFVLLPLAVYAIVFIVTVIGAPGDDALPF